MPANTGVEKQKCSEVLCDLPWPPGSTLMGSFDGLMFAFVGCVVGCLLCSYMALPWT